MEKKYAFPEGANSFVNRIEIIQVDAAPYLHTGNIFLVFSSPESRDAIKDKILAAVKTKVKTMGTNFALEDFTYGGNTNGINIGLKGPNAFEVSKKLLEVLEQEKYIGDGALLACYRELKLIVPPSSPVKGKKQHDRI